MNNLKDNLREDYISVLIYSTHPVHISLSFQINEVLDNEGEENLLSNSGKWCFQKLEKNILIL
jgi:hypothetical protein